jgi:hypothetical protein
VDAAKTKFNKAWAVQDASSNWMRAMKLPWIGWMFYGLAAIVVIGYIINGGLYVGSTIDFARGADGKPAYHTVCHYLYLDGAHQETTRTDRGFCPPFHPY